MFSQTVEYALRAVVWLSAHQKHPLTTEQMAGPIKVPPSYLSKVLQLLVRAGLVESQTGPRGGYRLARPPAEVTILDVVNVIEPLERITACPLGFEAHRGRLCPLHSRMDSARATVRNILSRCTMADLLHEDPSTVPLCVKVEEPETMIEVQA